MSSGAGGTIRHLIVENLYHLYYNDYNIVFPIWCIIQHLKVSAISQIKGGPVIMAQNPLTGLPNRQELLADLAERLAENERLLVIRVDAVHLKNVNALFGHKTGDQVLKHLAGLVSSWHDGLKAYHTGAVSFILVGSADIDIDMEAFREKACEAIEIDGNTIRPKVRIVYVYSRKGDTETDLTDLLRWASGRKDLLTQWILEADNGIRNDRDNDEHVTAELWNAINDRSFVIYYQPVYDLKQERFVSAEALIRLWDSEGNFISPGRFIPLAEKKHLIDRITDIVLDKVCDFLGRHPDLPIDSISVNMTPGQILDDELPQKLLAKAADAGTVLSKLRLEMTERTIQEDPGRTTAVMRELTRLGSGFYLDDFGTGYSNMSSVLSLPFEGIKFDKSLMDHLRKQNFDEKHAQMISLLGQMVHIGEAKIIAEGIEENESEELEWARRNGIDRVQGFFFSRPLPETEFSELIRRNGKEE